MTTQSGSQNPGSSTSYKCGIHEENGEFYQAWMDGVVLYKECPVARCQLTYDDMVQDNDFRTDMSPSPDDSLSHLATTFNFTPEQLDIPHQAYHQDVMVMQRTEEDDFDAEEIARFGDSWNGTVTNSIISLTYLQRRQNLGWSYMSEITDAVYHHLYPEDKVRYIFVYYVVNRDTIGFLKDHIYTAYQGVSTFFVPPGDTVMEWEYDTPEYKGILGTKIGKVVASYVLGHYDPGTVRISSIRTALQASEDIYLPRDHPEGHIAHFMFTLKHWDEDQHEYKLWKPETHKRKAEDEFESIHPPFKKYKGTPANKFRSKKHLSRPSSRPKTSRWPTSLLYRTLIHLFLIDLPAFLLVDRYLLSGYAGNGDNLIEAGWEFFHSWLQRFDGWPNMADLNFGSLLKFVGRKSS